MYYGNKPEFKLSRPRLVERNVAILSMCCDILGVRTVFLGVQCTKLREKGRVELKNIVTVTVTFFQLQSHFD